MKNKIKTQLSSRNFGTAIFLILSVCMFLSGHAFPGTVLLAILFLANYDLIRILAIRNNK